MNEGGMMMPSGDGGAGLGTGAAAGGGNFSEYGGIDPSLDPELAMAIRASTEEARAREEARVSIKLE
jgi:26S proteasome regulatory subunit N10